MTSKKPKSKSLSVSSQKGGYSKSRPAKSEALPAPDSDRAEATSGQLVRLHDLNGVVVFYLPREMRRILGAQLLSQQCTDLRRTQITWIVRTASDVIYVDMPILVKDLPIGVDSVANAGESSGSTADRRSKRGDRDA